MVHERWGGGGGCAFRSPKISVKNQTKKIEKDKKFQLIGQVLSMKNSGLSK